MLKGKRKERHGADKPTQHDVKKDREKYAGIKKGSLASRIKLIVG